jgi:hypothetical protein
MLALISWSQALVIRWTTILLACMAP